MVCMDDVFDWFNHLEGHKRIDFICGLLPMCHPLELRYIGSYLEDLAKKDFFILREAELKWNSIQHLCRLVDLSDPYTRSKIITAFALLHSYNTECANQLFLILQSNMQNVPILQSLANMDAAAMQTLLLLTMAVNHPAFTLIQRQEIREMLDEVIKITGIDNQEEEVRGADVSLDMSDSPEGEVNLSPQPCVRVVLTDISVTSSRRREEDKKLEFQIQVHWSNGITIDMCKTHAELLEFHNKLIHLFPDEAGAHRQDRQIPYLHSKRTDEIAQISANVTSYMRQMLSLPLKILDSDHVRQFFCDPTFPTTQSSRDSPASQRTHSSLDGASSRWSLDGATIRSASSLEGSSGPKTNTESHKREEDVRNDDVELRGSTATTDLRISLESMDLRKCEPPPGLSRDCVDGLRASWDSADGALDDRRTSNESSPKKVDGDTQTEEEFLDPPLEDVGLPDEVADETEGEESCDVTVVVPPISIPGSPPPGLPTIPPPPAPPMAPPMARLPANMALIDPLAALSLRPVAGCLVATTYPQTVMTGGTETSTTNRYAYSSNTVVPSPNSSPLPSPLISPRVACPSIQPRVACPSIQPPPLSVLTSTNRAVMINPNISVPQQVPGQPPYQQPRYQPPYEAPRYHHPPPPEQPRYDPSRYDSSRGGDRRPDSPRYDPRYNGPTSHDPASSASRCHHDATSRYQQQQQQHDVTSSSSRYHHDQSQRFRDVGRYRSDSPRSNRSRNPSQDSQRGNQPPETIADWLKLLRLHKYSEQLSKYSVEALMGLSEEDLEREGLTKGARKKLLSQIDKCREESRLLNGDVAWQFGPLYPLTIVTAKRNHKRYQSGGSSSVDSSASYSDCSSPSPSPLPLRKDSVTSDAEYDKDSEVSGSVRSYPSPNQHPPPKIPTNHSEEPKQPQPIIDQSTHFKPLPVQSHYVDSPTSSPGPQIIYQPFMPVVDQKYLMDRQQQQQQQHQHHPHQHHTHHHHHHPTSQHQHQHYLEKAAQYHHNSIPFNPNQPPPTGTPPSGCSQCGCNGDCTTAHPPPPLPYPVRFLTPAAQLGMFPPTFMTGGNGNGLVNPVFHQHNLLPNGISPELLYHTHNTFFLAAASQNHQNSMLSGQPGHHTIMPPIIPGSPGGPFLPVSSPVPVSSASNGNGKHGLKFTCYNCGQQGHKAAECKEASMEAMTHNGQYHLRYGPRGEDDR